jgi:hypothetical protein
VARLPFLPFSFFVFPFQPHGGNTPCAM